ncbi:MAG: hypothetical protein C4321_10895, partial [Chloroflexota bacterium]
RAGDARRLAYGVVVASSVYTGAFFAYLAFRSYNAEIAGTEQPMDLLFLNATMTSPTYPPHDPWFAGEPISYYYFGYLQAGVLSSLAGVKPSIGYNLALAATFAATASGVVSLSWALARWSSRPAKRQFVVVAAVTALALVLFAGSLSAVFEWAAAHERYNPTLYRAFGVDYLLPCEGRETGNCYAGATDPRTTAWYPTEYWFWWRGSRVIPGTITEFPFFSFLLGDLHPHVMALPLTTLATAFSAAVWRFAGCSTGGRFVRAYGGASLQQQSSAPSPSRTPGTSSRSRPFSDWRPSPVTPARCPLDALRWLRRVGSSRQRWPRCSSIRLGGSRSAPKRAASTRTSAKVPARR